MTAAPARTAARVPDQHAAYAPGVSDTERERDERRLERDRRRREQGRPTYFDTGTISEGWPLLTDAAHQPTRIIRPGRLRDPATRAVAADAARVEELPPEPAAGEASAILVEHRRLALSTAIFSLATALSRVFGLVREVVAAYYFGASGRINAFTIAFQLPNLVRALVADAALSSAFVPVFSELIEKGERKRAWRVASTLFWLMLLGLAALTAIFILVAPWVIGIFGNPGHDKVLAVGLSRVLFPIVALLGVSGIVVGILNTYDHFTVPALSPVFWNIAIIVGLVIGVPQAQTMSTKLYVYAISIVVATFIQVLLPIPWLRGLDGRLRLALDWRDPMVKRVFVLMVPVTLGLGLINVNAVIDMFFASRLINGDLAPTAIQKAFLVYMLPQGMFSVAIATVLFPTLSRLSARGDVAGFRSTVAMGLRQITFLLAPAAVVSAVLAEPIVRLLFQRGHFLPNQTPVVAACLAAFSAGLVFNGTMLLLNRAFFSLQSNWVPLAVALANLFLNAVLDLALYRVGIWGIPLATAIVNLGGTAALLVLLRRNIGPIEGARTMGAVVRIAAASALVAGVAYVVWQPLDDLLGRSFPAQVVSVGFALAASGLVYIGACRALRVREVETLLALRGRLTHMR
jgi:putative peptidoglycan lipid II flippase